MRRVAERASADARRQAEIGVVGNVERVVVIGGADHRGHGTENLLAVEAHVVGGLGKQRRRQVEAVVFAVEALAAARQLGALRGADVDIGKVLVELGGIDDGAHLGALLERIVHR